MASEPLVSIGIVSWNSADYLPGCLGAVQNQTHGRLELLVVDNASQDTSLECCQQHGLPLRLVKNSANLGFARAHNQAIELAQGDYYLALNPDVMLAPSYVQILVAALSADSGLGSAGGKLLLDANHIDSAGLFLDRKRRQYLRGHQQMDTGQYDRAGEVFGIDGAAPLYRREMIRDVAESGQFFDEAFVTYKEDVDVAWRARLLGWGAWYAPTAVAVHRRTFRPGQRQRGSPETRRYSVRNRYLTLIKNETPAGWRRDWPQILGYDLGILAYLLAAEQASLPALLDVYRTWPAMRRKHRELMRRQRVPDASLLRWMN